MQSSIRLMVCAHLIILLLVRLAAANVEKTIFVAPAPNPIPPEDPGLDDLGLERLSPSNYMVRTMLNVSFSTDDAPRGTESWFYLEDLHPGKRYEVRVCWLATQPTAFSLTTYTLSETVLDPSLLSALTTFSDAHLARTSSSSSSRPLGDHNQYHSAAAIRHDSRRRRSRSNLEKQHDPLASTSHTESVLFLRVFAAADYFTTNKTLMEKAPPVMVDLILDPFLFNIFPRSLIPTAAWSVIIAIVAYFIGGWISTIFTDTVCDVMQADGQSVRATENEEQTEEKKER